MTNFINNWNKPLLMDGIKFPTKPIISPLQNFHGHPVFDDLIFDSPFKNDTYVNGGPGDDKIFINENLPGGDIHVNGGSGDDLIVIGKGPGPNPSPQPTSPVAANETGKIWGDPHFIGGDGGEYDVQGEAGKTYDLLSDSGLQLRGQFDEWSNDTGLGEVVKDIFGEIPKKDLTVVGETGLTVGEMDGKNDNVNFRKDGTARINGKLMQEGKTYQLADGGTATLNGKTLTVTTAEGYTINQTAQGSGEKAYIDIEVKTGADGVDNGKLPGGLLGQTFDADNIARNGKKGAGAQGEGAIDGVVTDYEVNGLDPINDDRNESGIGENNPIPNDIWQQILELFKNKQEELGIGDPNLNQSPMKTTTYGGSDRVNLFNKGEHYVDLGTGSDKAYVDFSNVTDSKATIRGGSGNDTVTLKGAESDYTLHHEFGFKVYTDDNGNSIHIANDVENIEFTQPDAHIWGVK